MSILGIHHVTAITARIEENLAFYTGVLGLRLVKKTVNQDDVSAYHLFYADAVASPGTDMTFFDWPRSDSNRAGYATVALTTMRIPGSSLEAWKERLSVAGVPVEADTDGAGRARLVFQDFEGQRLAFVDDTGMRGEGVPWTEVVPVEMATRGILGVDLESARPDSTRRVMTELLGYEDIDGTRFALTGETASEVNVIEPTTSRIGSPGAGGVHHVAFRVKDDESLLAMKDRIEAFGIHTSGYVDRFYFHSLYFREPGGVLFELATDGPGMASDESADHLGESLSLPLFLEGRRTEIVAGLKPLD
ncbi:MAG: ring-cleaving dioxygenase [Armatimonadetes bacterium]|nr:ring-cleaving dioxygenase [Armatimonadota bacterium]